MERLATAGWDGPEYVGDGKYRYSKCSGWIRLYIDIEDAGFYGGVTGTDSDFEVVFADGKWKRFCTEPAQVNGEPMLRLIEYSTLDLILARVGKWHANRRANRYHRRIWRLTLRDASRISL